MDFHRKNFLMQSGSLRFGMDAGKSSSTIYSSNQMMQALFRWLRMPNHWLLLFISLCTLLFASAEVITLCMFFTGIYLLFKNGLSVIPIEAKKDYFTISLIFFSVFFFKLLSALWALDAKDAIDNAFNNIHYLLWPGIAIFMLRTTLDPTKIYSVIARVLCLLCAWYMIALLYFPNSEDAHCFKAGGGNCGLLGTPLAFFLVWLFVPLTDPSKSFSSKYFLFFAFAAGLVAFIGTLRRTELLWIIPALLAVICWRYCQRSSKAALKGALVAVLLFTACAGIFFSDRLYDVKTEIAMYQQGGVARDLSVKSTSVGQRIEMYRIALTAITDRPLLGWGAGIKPRHLAKYAHDPLSPFPYSNFHQQYLQIVLELGVLGFAIACLGMIRLIYEVVYKIWKRGDHEVALLSGLLISLFLWKGLANGVIGYSIFNTVIAVFTAWFWAWSVRSKK